MSVTPLKQPPSKSRTIIHDCIRRVLRLVTRREVKLLAVVMIDASGKVHLDRIGPITWQETDQMLEGLEQLHEEIYMALRN